MLALDWWPATTEGQWYVDLITIAGVLTAAGIIWRLGLWPGLKAVWSAILAAPKIADGVGEVVHLIESDVLGKLEDIKVESATHAVQAAARDERLNLHGLTLEDHELRLGKVEQALKGIYPNEGRYS